MQPDPGHDSEFFIQQICRLRRIHRKGLHGDDCRAVSGGSLQSGDLQKSVLLQRPQPLQKFRCQFFFMDEVSLEPALFQPQKRSP